MSVNLLTTPLETYAYKLAPTGHRLQVREGNGRLVNYQYDNIYRLTRESILFSSIVGDIDYGLDPVGNRLNMNSTVLGIPSQVNTFDDNDRLNSDTYDANGNTVGAAVPGGTATDTYDFENRLTNRVVGATTISIVYDGDGNRVSKTVNGLTRHFLVDDNNLTGFAQVFEELDGALNVDVVYTYGLDLISQERFDGTGFVTHFYGYDGHGNVRLLTDSAGTISHRYDYDAFGNLIASSGATPNNYLYTGEQFDPDLGMYFLRARYMDTTRGRFWTQDEFEGINRIPPTLHKYLAVHGDPVNLTDPSGTAVSLVEVQVASTLDVRLSIGFTLATVLPFLSDTRDLELEFLGNPNVIFDSKQYRERVAEAQRTRERDRINVMRLQLQRGKPTFWSMVLVNTPKKGVTVAQADRALILMEVAAATGVNGFPQKELPRLQAAVTHLMARIEKLPPLGISGGRENLRREFPPYRVDLENIAGTNLRNHL